MFNPGNRRRSRTMDTPEEIAYLIRLAREHPEHADSFLEVAEGKLMGLKSPETLLQPESPTATFPLGVFAERKGRRYEGRLLGNRGMEINGKRFRVPSGAAREVLGYEEDGWRFWKWTDPRSGAIRPIDDLRRGGLL
jgi:hypothetical protein